MILGRWDAFKTGHESMGGPDEQSLEEQVLLDERERPAQEEADACEA